MRVATGHFFGIFASDILDVEPAFFLIQPGNKKYLKEHIAKLIANFVRVIGGDGVKQFKDFFYQIDGYGSGRLFFVPGASVFSPEYLNQFNQINQSFQEIFSGWGAV
jgi:hypothetical protein